MVVENLIPQLRTTVLNLAVANMSWLNISSSDEKLCLIAEYFKSYLFFTWYSMSMKKWSDCFQLNWHHSRLSLIYIST